MARRSLPHRTEVISGRENVMDEVIRFVAGARKKIDGCLYKTRPLLATGIEPLKRSLVDAKCKGIRIRYVTEITDENLTACKELMKVAAEEIRHLDGIKGTFYLSDTEYVAPAIFHEKGKPASQMIYSNVREIVEHQQYIFDTLWNKAIPAQLKIKEIEEGLVPDFIDTIKDPQKNQLLAHLSWLRRTEVMNGRENVTDGVIRFEAAQLKIKEIEEGFVPDFIELYRACL